jgi:hypothetical protein
LGLPVYHIIKTSYKWPNPHEILSVYGDVATPSMPFMALSAEHSNSCNKKSAGNGLLDEFS